jgi:hypothetical protein
MKHIRRGGANERCDREAHAPRNPSGVEKPPVPDWKRAHDELVRLAKTRARLDRDEGHWLVVAAREGTHARLG